MLLDFDNKWKFEVLILVRDSENFGPIEVKSEFPDIDQSFELF